MLKSDPLLFVRVSGREFGGVSSGDKAGYVTEREGSRLHRNDVTARHGVFSFL